jgi:glycosyltransferase involved in cell wall biosynthesis
MKLLITTQAVDINDPILGFFHGWLLEFAKHFERIEVICLYEGVHHLPVHVHVHSLGKEEGMGYVRYLGRLVRYVWRLRNEYDAVFSHMNPHYIVLVGWLWVLLGKPMYFWRNHAKMNWMTRVAARFARRVFYTSPFACTAQYAHALQMPVGIDTETFAYRPHTRGEEVKLLCITRLSPVKRVEVLVSAAAYLPAGYELHIYGNAPLHDRVYAAALTKNAPHTVHFYTGVPNSATPAIYAAHDMFINLTPNGSMDKTVLEAVSCGTLTLVANESFLGVLPPALCMEGEVSPEQLAARIVAIGTESASVLDEYRKTARMRVEEQHSRTQLGNNLHSIIHESH